MLTLALCFEKSLNWLKLKATEQWRQFSGMSDMVGGFDGWCLPLEIQSRINSFPQVSLMLFVVDARCARAAFRNLDDAVESGVRPLSIVNPHHGLASPCIRVGDASNTLATSDRPLSARQLAMNVPLGAPSMYSPSSARQPSRQPRLLAPGPSFASTSQSSVSAASSPSNSQEADSAKKKRCRVTKEQLVQLETLFAANMSPTIQRRREIAIALEMTERQTQIWFQNRRAKQRIAEGRLPRKRRKPRRTEADEMMSTIAPPPPDSPPGISAGFDRELHALINENDAVTIIPCESLTVGTWRRMSVPNAKNTLVAYVCEAAQKVSWFIQDAGKGFKISIPFDTIVNAEFELRSLSTPPSASTSHSTGQAQPTQPGLAIATIHLSRPPLFSFQTDIVHPSGPGSSNVSIIARRWHVCHDWTEGQQATHVLRHCLYGPPIPLRHFVNSLNRRLMQSGQATGGTSAWERGFDGGEDGMRDTPSPTDSSAPSTEYYTPMSTANSDYMFASQPVSPLEMTSGLPLPVGDAFEAFPFPNANSPPISTPAAAGQHMMYLEPRRASADPARAYGPSPRPQVLQGYYAGPQNSPPFQAPEQELSSPSASQFTHGLSMQPSSASPHDEQDAYSEGPSSLGGGMPMPDPSESLEYQGHFPHMQYHRSAEQQPEVGQQAQLYHPPHTQGHAEGSAYYNQGSSVAHSEYELARQAPQQQHFPSGLAVPAQDSSYELYSSSQQTTPTPIAPFPASPSSLAAMLTVPRIPVPTTKYYTLEYPFETPGSASSATNSSTAQHHHQQQHEHYTPPDNIPLPDTADSSVYSQHQPSVVSSMTLSQADVAAYFQQQVLQAQSNYNYSTVPGSNPESPSIISPAPRYLANAQRLQEDIDAYAVNHHQGDYN
ncbi:hypothetical protein NMY22_g14459 [Coprinellus aureogranulatus]|nr:hypothetical protein NMY22_g14459 [Coprinellus aureogranulatus]